MSRPLLSRRQVLRAASGLTLTLPFLPSLAHGQTAAPRRFVAMYVPNGVYPQTWWPVDGASETDFALNTTFSSLADLKSHLLFVGGLDLKCALTGPGEQHQRGLGGLLTGTTLQAGQFVGNDGSTAGWANGPSVDQEIARLVGAGAKARSLQLGVKASERDVSGVLSYQAAATPLLPQNNPLLVFSSMFTDTSTPVDAMEKLRRRRASVLDAVQEQLAAVQGRLAVSERPLLDEHLTYVRELEVRLTGVQPNPLSCTTPTAPPATLYDTPGAMNDVSRLQLDLLVLAFKCDATRVASLMYSDAKNHTPLPFINVYGDVHNISHLPDVDPARADLGKRDGWEAEQFGYLVRKLSQTTEGAGTLLDSTLLFWGTDVSRGNTHAHDNMPFVLAGHGTGWRMGRSLHFTGQAHNDLLVSMLQGFGGTQTTFGDAQFCAGPLGNLV